MCFMQRRFIFLPKQDDTNENRNGDEFDARSISVDGWGPRLGDRENRRLDWVNIIYIHPSHMAY